MISRLLFGRGTGGLSPLQAAQLAQATSGLLGLGGEGFLDRLRRGTGLDELTVESDDNGEDSIRGGRYIADGVFLKMEQGLKPDSGKVGLEVRVLPRVTVDGDVGGQGTGELGVNFRYDY